MTQTIVYKYTLKAPIEGEERLRSEMDLARGYRNNLIAAHRWEREAKRVLLLAIPAISETYAAAVAARADTAAAHEAVRLAHSTARTRVHSEEAEARLKASKDKYVESLKVFDKTCRTEMKRPEVRAEIVSMESIGYALRKSAAKYSGVWWGTKSAVVDDMDRSLRLVLAPGKSIAKPLWDGVDPYDPQFVRRGDHTDFVALYINESTRPRLKEFMRIEPAVLRENARPNEKPRERFALRIGMEEDINQKGKMPVWVRWPMHPDRPLPPDAEVTGVRVTCEREARSERWHAHVTLRTDAVPRGAPLGTGRVAVDVGWRKVGDELRIARWKAEDGSEGEIRLDGAMLGALTKGDSLQSIRTRWFNEAREEFRRWLEGREVPEWLRVATAHMEDWKQQGRLAGLVTDWRRDSTKHFDGAWDAILALEIWRRQDAHLWHWESAQRNQGMARRKEFFRVEAAKLARRFGQLTLETFDLRTFARKPDVLDKVDVDTRRAARLASCGEFRMCLEQAFIRRGGQVERIDAKHTTHTCPTCNVKTAFDAAKSIDWTCSGCGAQWDQDDSAARILLQRSKDLAAEAAEPVVPGKREGRWSRVSRKKRERGEVEAGP